MCCISLSVNELSINCDKLIYVYTYKNVIYITHIGIVYKLLYLCQRESVCVINI